MPGAVDTATQQPVAGPTEEVRELLDHLDVAGNNGWFDAPGKRDAKRILRELDHNLVDRDYTVGAMLAAGHSKKSLDGLEKL